jgi:hypothetical protein
MGTCVESAIVLDCFRLADFADIEKQTAIYLPVPFLFAATKQCFPSSFTPLTVLNLDLDPGLVPNIKQSP